MQKELSCECIAVLSLNIEIDTQHGFFMDPQGRQPGTLELHLVNIMVCETKNLAHSKENRTDDPFHKAVVPKAF